MILERLLLLKSISQGKVKSKKLSLNLLKFNSGWNKKVWRSINNLMNSLWVLSSLNWMNYPSLRIQELGNRMELYKVTKDISHFMITRDSKLV